MTEGLPDQTGHGDLRSERRRGRETVRRTAKERGNVMIDKELLEIMACPKCKADVRLENDKIICTNPECGLRYPIRDGIPVMLIDQAEKSGK